jgi:hypothetical protein
MPALVPPRVAGNLPDASGCHSAARLTVIPANLMVTQKVKGTGDREHLTSKKAPDDGA